MKPVLKTILKAIPMFVGHVFLACIILQMYQFVRWLFDHNLSICRYFPNDWIIIVAFGAIGAYRLMSCEFVIANTERHLDTVNRMCQREKFQEIDVTDSIRTYKVPHIFWKLYMAFEETEQELRLYAPRYIIKGIQKEIEGYDIPPPVK